MIIFSSVTIKMIFEEPVTYRYENEAAKCLAERPDEFESGFITYHDRYDEWHLRIIETPFTDVEALLHELT